jgi:hypothetical protein
METSVWVGEWTWGMGRAESERERERECVVLHKSLDADWQWAMDNWLGNTNPDTLTNFIMAIVCLYHSSNLQLLLPSDTNSSHYVAALC